MTDEPWAFEADPASPVLTQRGVAFLGKPVLVALHDPEGDWALLGTNDLAADRAHVLGLAALIERDPTLRELSDLPRAWCAVRSAPGESWRRAALSAQVQPPAEAPPAAEEGAEPSGA